MRAPGTASRPRQNGNLQRERVSETATYAGDLSVTNCDDDDVLSRIAWYCGNSDAQPQPVGGLEPNAFGIFDMLGNVFEWVWDYYDDYPGGSVTDPSGPESGDSRVIRGGSWQTLARQARAAFRANAAEDSANARTGFRPVRTAPLCEGAMDDEIVFSGAYGVCERFDDVCDETGLRFRDAIVCLDGQPGDTVQDEACERDTDGVECQGPEPA